MQAAASPISIDVWFALAFVAGLSSAFAYYKDLRWLACALLFGLPVITVVALGWPYDIDFEDTSAYSVVLWAFGGFVGLGLGVTAIVLRIVR